MPTDAYGNNFRYQRAEEAVPPPSTPTDAPEPPAGAPPPRALRVLCLHGAYLAGRILAYSLSPVERAFRKRAPHARLELIFPNGLQEYRVAELQARAAADPQFHASLAAELAAIEAFELEHVYMWADNDDSGAHGGRQFHNLPDVLPYVRRLLELHAPVDGVLGMSQGAMVAQLAAAQACAGRGPPLQFALLFGGPRPGWQWQLPELFPEEGLRVHTLLVSGAQDWSHGSRSEPGCHGMAALVAAGYVARRTHADGHTILPKDREEAAELVEEIVDFLLDPAAVVAEYPAREERRVQEAKLKAEREEAENKRKAEEMRLAMKQTQIGGEEGIAALKALGLDPDAYIAQGTSQSTHFDSMSEMLVEGGLEHLVDLLAEGKSLSSWCELHNTIGRNGVMKELKELGIELKDRQKFATLVAKTAKAASAS
ncbi:hypothetical protein AB1Y20_016806 [Prymnesium parvum]|uniref:Serine hydrolase domain-containing protein n=1 Tax=Prymnesium parvum TaxID=97485 RepID=A0AB34IDF2_PRYPA